MPIHRPPPLAVLACIVAAVALPSCGGDVPAERSYTPAELDRVWKGEGPVIEVKVHELHCSNCENEARKAVGALEGVDAVQANHETDIVRIDLEAGRDRYATIPAIREALHSVGKDIVGEDEIP